MSAVTQALVVGTLSGLIAAVGGAIVGAVVARSFTRSDRRSEHDTSSIVNLALLSAKLEDACKDIAVMQTEASTHTRRLETITQEVTAVGALVEQLERWIIPEPRRPGGAGSAQHPG